MNKLSRIALMMMLIVIQTGPSLLFPTELNAASSFSPKTHILFLTGTDSPLKKGREYQDAYKYIANSLASTARLGIPVNRQRILNYTSSNIANQGTISGWVLPAVITAKLSGKVLAPGPDKKFAGCYQSAPIKEYLADAWLNAYFVAWRIQRYLGESGATNVLLVGHSQGGVIARIIQVIANKSASPSLTSTDSGLRKECWPNLAGKIKGIVTVGAPLSAQYCEGFGPFQSERVFIDQARYVAGNALMIGADPGEVMNENSTKVEISLSCATRINATGSTRAAIYALGANADVLLLEREKRSAVIECNEGAYGRVRVRAHHELKKGDSFTLSGNRPSLWNGTYTVLNVISNGSEFEFCLPKVKAGITAVSQLGTFSAAALQKHTWYIEGAGKCPAWVLRTSPVSGKDEGWCAYKTRGTMEFYPLEWSQLVSKVSGKDRALPGNIYDLIADVVSKWAP